MRQKEDLKAISRSNRGAVSIFVAVVLLSLIGMASFAIDIGYIAVTKSELQNASDAASLAASRHLGVIYEGMSTDEQQTYYFDPDNPAYSSDYAAIISAAQSVVGDGKNIAGGKNLTIRPEDIKINVWNGSEFDTNSWEGTAFPPPPDAVKVTVRRDNINNGPVSTFFARILGINEVEVIAASTAALTNTNLPDPLDLVDVGVSRNHFDSDYCGEPIDFTLCVAEFVMPTDSDGDERPEEVKIDALLSFTGVIINDSADIPLSPTGTTVLAVFEDPEGTNICGDQPLKVVGFAEVGGDPTNRVWKCTFHKGSGVEGRGFGDDFPLKSTIPGLVR
jgi:hypothetical protein